MENTDWINGVWNRIDGVYIPKEFEEMKRYKTKSTKALGIDPGLANTGYAVVTRNRRGQFRILASGCITTDKRNETPSRMLEIYTGVTELLQTHTPDLLSVERVFWNRNITSAMSTAAVMHISLLAAEVAGITSKQVTPQQVKAACGCGGKANKAAVKVFVSKLTGETLTNAHTADAAACAIAGYSKAENRLTRAGLHLCL